MNALGYIAGRTPGRWGLLALAGWLALSGWPGLAAATRGDDWPQFGGGPGRNMVATCGRLPADFAPGEKSSDGSGIDLANARNVRWTARLGSETYSSPVVAGGRVYIGTNDAHIGDPKYQSSQGGLLLCLDQSTGKVLWRLVIPKLESNHKSSRFEEMDLGLCSPVTVEGNRVYLVTNRAEVLCLDVAGMSNGNDGPVTDEGQYSVGPGRKPVTPGPTDADIIWRYDLIGQLNVWPHDASCSAVLIHGDCAYVCTANGVDGEKSPAPLAPSLIALDKRTGRLVAQDAEKIGTRVFHGQWSSPALGEVGGRTLVFFGAGDGVCYAFEALERLPPGGPVPLTKVWSCQCNPPEYLVRGGKPLDYWAGDRRKNRGNHDDGRYVGPNEIIGSPVFYKNRIYVTIGQDPLHGRGRGALTCIDATGTGDITPTGKRWIYRDLDRSLSTVAIAGGLLYVADRPGTIHCLDAETGRRLWAFDAKAEIWGSTLVADGKLFVGTKKCFLVMATGRQPRVLARIHLGTPAWATPAVAGDTLFVASQAYLWAVGETPSAKGAVTVSAAGR